MIGDLPGAVTALRLSVNADATTPASRSCADASLGVILPSWIFCVISLTPSRYLPHEPCLPYGTPSPNRFALRSNRGASADSAVAPALGLSGVDGGGSAGFGGSVDTNACHCDVLSLPPICTHAVRSDVYDTPSCAFSASRSDMPRPTSSSAFIIFCATPALDLSDCSA